MVRSEIAHLLSHNFSLVKSRLCSTCLAYSPPLQNKLKRTSASLTLSPAELEKLAGDVLGEYTNFSGEHSPRSAKLVSNVGSLVGGARRLYETNNYYNPSWELFREGSSLGCLNPPRPKNLGAIPASNFRWICDVKIGGYKLPQRQEFGPSTIQHTLRRQRVRVTCEGFAFICPNLGCGHGDLDVTLVRPSLHIMTDPEVLARLFISAGYNSRQSDKGGYQAFCTNSLGNLKALAAFLSQEPHRNLLDAFVNGTTGT